MCVIFIFYIGIMNRDQLVDSKLIKFLYTYCYFVMDNASYYNQNMVKLPSLPSHKYFPVRNMATQYKKFP